MMKKQLCLFLLAGGITFLSFAEGIAQEAERGNERADYSYAFGMVIAADLEQLGMEFNYDAFMRGFREFSENLDTRYTLDEAVERIQTAFDAAQEAQAESNRRIEAEFLAQNASKPGVFTTSSGLQYEIITEGTGRQPAETDTVKVHYRGLLADGTVFDSSLDRGEPEEFPLPGVIPGWSEGIQLMREGGRSRFFIPSELAYGSQGTGAIPPASLLIFEVELLEILDTPLPEESELPGREE